MNNNRQINTDEQRDELQVQVYLTQYEKLHEHMMQFLSGQQQSIVLALGSASIAVPILLGQTGSIPAGLIIVLLYTLSIIYAAIALNYASTTYAVGEIGKYLYYHIEPKVNKLVETSVEHGVMHWQSFVVSERAHFLSGFLAYIGPIGSILLLLLPGAVSVITAQYLLYETQTVQPIAPSQFTSSLLSFLPIIAWGMYLLAVLSLILSTIWWSKWFKAG